ncbi:hypothetical protein QR680_008736 [Steinernema hermaphroditum]|uniref:Uncharacterized protein n=1 Tax=Steinernema hermaphroditum TaxID=289476 RepID=A0AA39IHR5_9BILA|nr:hypothetical protein QR680_008736 [Steinernema hermaphroditum]
MTPLLCLLLLAFHVEALPIGSSPLQSDPDDYDGFQLMLKDIRASLKKFVDDGGKVDSQEGVDIMISVIEENYLNITTLNVTELEAIKPAILKMTDAQAKLGDLPNDWNRTLADVDIMLAAQMDVYHILGHSNKKIFLAVMTLWSAESWFFVKPPHKNGPTNELNNADWLVDQSQLREYGRLFDVLKSFTE